MATIMATVMAAIAALLVAALPPAGAVAADRPWGLADLFAAFARIDSSSARFTETRTVSLLNAPLESSGTLTYRRPDLLEKTTLQPRAESLRVEGDRLTLSRADGAARTLSVSSMPEIQTYVESIRATLRGDVPTMMRFYDVALEGSPENWLMRLTPRAAEASAVVERIEIAGRKAEIGRIDVRQADGDRSTMTILPDPP